MIIIVNKKLDEYVNKIVEKTQGAYSEEDIKGLIENKKESFRGSIKEEVAISMVCNDLGFNSSDIESEPIPIKETVMEKVEKFDLAVPSPKQPLSIMEGTRYPSEEEIRFLINRRKFVKDTLIDKAEDLIKISGTLFLKKSGTQKYINAFGISIEILSNSIYPVGEDKDLVAEYRIKATAPNGQFVIADGTKNKSEYWSDKYKNFGSYSLHNLKATARTRAIHIAVSDLVGYGELSLASLSRRNNDELPEKEFIFQD